MNPLPKKSKTASVLRSGAPLDVGLIAETPLHRRSFFGVVSTGAVAGLIQAAVPAAAAQRVTSFLNGDSLMLDKITHELFLEHVGDTFGLAIGPGQNTKIELSRVTPLSQGLPERRPPFSLFFTAPPTTGLSQRIYELSHPKLGSMQVFLVPVKKDAHGLVLEAVFN